MLFNTWKFACFFFTILIAFYYLSKTEARRKYQKVLLFTANIIFYAAYSYEMLVVILILMIISFFLGLALERKKKKIIIVLSLVGGIGLLYIVKYLNFTIQLLSRGSIQGIYILAPVGISFFTFQFISYLIDVYSGKISAEKDFIVYGAWLSLFATISSGPIIQYKNIKDSIREGVAVSEMDLEQGTIRVLIGLFKKNVVADSLAFYVDAAWSDLSPYGGISLYLLSVMYTMQIYADFSGYSDIAIGCARMLGLDFGTNFQTPYFASNIKDFWRRWHQSLTRWFTEYVYIPLGGSRRGIIRQIVNTLVVFLLSGVWHGANLTFFLWGIFHGIFSVINILKEKVSALFVVEKGGMIYEICARIFGIIITFNIVNIGWILFRADSLYSAIMFIKTMLVNRTTNMNIGIFNSITVSQWWMIVFPLIILIVVDIIDFAKKDFAVILCNLHPLIRVGVSVIFVYLIYIYTPIESQQQNFIYFQF